MSLSLEGSEKDTGEIGFDNADSSGSESVEYKHVVLQQSVTMLAYMDRTTHNSTITAGIAEPQMLMGFSIHDLPIVIGAAIGTIGLITIVLAALIIWHCCKLRGNSDKAYRLDNSSPEGCFLKQNGRNIVQSDSVVYLDAKNNLTATKTVSVQSDHVHAGFPRSQSVCFQESKENYFIEDHKTFPKKRPSSQPVSCVNFIPSSTHSPKLAQSLYTQHCSYGMHNEENGYGLGLPSIPEVVIKSSDILTQVPVSLYASCNA